MRQKITNIAALIALFTLAVTAAVVWMLTPSAFAAAARSSNVPVTTFLADLNSNGAAYDVQSDGRAGINGSVGEYDDGSQGVTSWLTANTYNRMPPGDWQFDVVVSTIRTMRITLASNAVQPGQPGYTTPQGSAPFYGTQFVPAQIEEKCTAVFSSTLGTYLDIGTMNRVGQAYACPATLRFSYGGNSYHLVQYGSYAPTTDQRFPETTQIWITCTSVDASSKCNAWDFDPIPSGQPGYNANGSIARLTQATNKASILLGDYYLTYHYHVTRP